METIRSALKCSMCNGYLNTPVIMPCGETICEIHANSQSEESIYCFGCGKSHEIPKDGFIRVKSLERIMETRINEFNLGKEHSDAVESMENFKEAIGQLSLLIREPDYVLNETVDSFKRRVHLKREELKLLIDEDAECLIDSLDNYHKQSMHQTGSSELKKMIFDWKKNLTAMEDFLNVCEKDLKKMELNIDKWKTIKTNCDSFCLKLNDASDQFKHALFMRKIDDLEAKCREFESISIKSIFKLSSLSKILDENNGYDLSVLCNFDLNQRFRLLYRASRDGFAASEFHSKCDGKSDTLTVIKTTQQHIFGGYTRAVWDKSGTYKTDPNAFIFSLVNASGQKHKLNVSKYSQDHAIFCTSAKGPCFGQTDILIADNSDSGWKSSSLLQSYTSNSNYPSNRLLTNSKHFQCIEIEVFQKI